MNNQIRIKDALDGVQYDLNNLASLIHILALGIESMEVPKGERRKALEAVENLTCRIEEKLITIVDDEEH